MALPTRMLVAFVLAGVAIPPASSHAELGDTDAGGLYFYGSDSVRYSVEINSGDLTKRDRGRDRGRSFETFVVLTEPQEGWLWTDGPLEGLCLACEGESDDPGGAALSLYEDEPRRGFALTTLERLAERVGGAYIEPLTAADVEIAGTLHRKFRPTPRLTRIRGSVRFVINATFDSGPFAGASLVVKVRGRYHGSQATYFPTGLKVK